MTPKMYAFVCQHLPEEKHGYFNLFYGMVKEFLKTFRDARNLPDGHEKLSTLKNAAELAKMVIEHLYIVPREWATVRLDRPLADTPAYCPRFCDIEAHAYTAIGQGVEQGCTTFNDKGSRYFPQNFVLKEQTHHA